MDEKDIFRKLVAGAKFDLKRFRSDAERLKVVKPRVAQNRNNPPQQASVADIKATFPTGKFLTMEDSIAVLKQQLATGVVVSKFENLYKEKPGLSMTAAKLNCNKSKNRYIDILPYDTTRVKLSGPDDYINASFINMQPTGGNPGSSSGQCAGRYIASQGPLPQTVGDFWKMVWQQEAGLIVMVTAEVEGRHIKCHRYWPSTDDQVVRHGSLSLKCVSENATETAVFREFLLKNDAPGATASRTIRHMQYIVWPDHGMPSDCRSFLNFVNKVREALCDTAVPALRGPPIIHCSAGVGRTGVLIGLNTALCAMEAGQPIDMVEIAQRMRDQRGIMVQTSEQFRFLCEAVVKLYEERSNMNNSAVVRRSRSLGAGMDTDGSSSSGDEDEVELSASDEELSSEEDGDNDADDGRSEGDENEWTDEETDKLTAAADAAALPRTDESLTKKRKKKPKTAERLTQIHQEEVNHFRNQHHIHVYGTDVADPVDSFERLETEYSVNPKIVSNLRTMSFTAPTVIEMQAIPVMLHRRELMACAPTGSGKTLAFVLPILHHLKAPKNGGFRALVLAPTRELAEQTYREFNRIGDGLGIRAHVIHKASTDVKKYGDKLFHKFDVLVTTPNRLIYLLQQESPLSLSTVEWLVIDESDKLFEEGKTGFRDQLAAIYKACDSKDVRRAMFSATFSYDVEEWCRLNLDNVVQVYVGARNSVAQTIQQELLYVGDESGKLLAVREMIRKGIQPPVLIFVQSKDRAKDLFHELVYDGINVDVIHADRTQNQRDSVVRGFRSGTIWVLICTDVMCRGMDFKGVNLVINYDFPNSDYVYIHRIGRTGRAGRPGKAVTFFTDDDAVNLRCIANKMREAGCDVPDYMLKLKAPSRSLKRKLKKSAPRRDSIRTDAALAKKKFKRSKTSQAVKTASTTTTTTTTTSKPSSQKVSSDRPKISKKKRRSI